MYCTLLASKPVPFLLSWEDELVCSLGAVCLFLGALYMDLSQLTDRRGQRQHCAWLITHGSLDYFQTMVINLGKL